MKKVVIFIASPLEINIKTLALPANCSIVWVGIGKEAFQVVSNFLQAIRYTKEYEDAVFYNIGSCGSKTFNAGDILIGSYVSRYMLSGNNPSLGFFSKQDGIENFGKKLRIMYSFSHLITVPAISEYPDDLITPRASCIDMEASHIKEAFDASFAKNELRFIKVVSDSNASSLEEWREAVVKITPIINTIIQEVSALSLDGEVIPHLNLERERLKAKHSAYVDILDKYKTGRESEFELDLETEIYSLANEIDQMPLC